MDLPHKQITRAKYGVASLSKEFLNIINQSSVNLVCNQNKEISIILLDIDDYECL